MSHDHHGQHQHSQTKSAESVLDSADLCCHTPHPGKTEHNSHDKHAGHSVSMFRDKFWLSLILTIPVLLYSEMIQEWLGFTIPKFYGSKYVPLVLGTAIFFYGGIVFIKSAINELKAKQPGMMTLISLAIVSAFVYSLLTTFLVSGSEFFWELATLIVIMLLGHWIEMKSVADAQGALKELAKLLPDTAELENGKQIMVSELKAGNVVIVRPGSKAPSDGIVIEGSSEMNESLLTGESKPVFKYQGMGVIAGTINGTGSLKVKVTKVGDATALSGIMRLVAQAQASKSRAQILADKAAFYLTIVAIFSGAATLVGWILAGKDLAFAFERTVTVLVIACPHALGLAVPLVTSISTTLGAKNGLLVKQRMALESARNINVVLFDKTGTLTKGEQAVSDIWSLKMEDKDFLALVSAAETNSEHMIGRAIVKKAHELGVAQRSAKDFRALPGHGVEAKVDGRTVAIGGPQLYKSKNSQVPDELEKYIKQAGDEGKTVVFVWVENRIIGAIAVTDLIREESVQAVSKLQRQGIRVAMITGDSEDVAKYVAGRLGIKEYFSQVLPEHKAEKVKQLQNDGSRVAMVGDGVNDAPALTQADLGIAIGAGTDVAIESAGIVLVKNNPLDIPKIIRLSKATYWKMVQNLFWATGYNVLAIPLAAGVFGLILPPALAAVLMSVSTVVVAANAQFLRKIKF